MEHLSVRTTMNNDESDFAIDGLIFCRMIDKRRSKRKPISKNQFRAFFDLKQRIIFNLSSSLSILTITGYFLDRNTLLVKKKD